MSALSELKGAINHSSVAGTSAKLPLPSLLETVLREKSPLFKNKSLYIGCLRSIFIHVTEQLVVFPPPCPDKEGCCPC